MPGRGRAFGGQQSTMDRLLPAVRGHRNEESKRKDQVGHIKSKTLTTSNIGKDVEHLDTKCYSYAHLPCNLVSTLKCLPKA